MVYNVVSYIRVEAENPVLFGTLEEAQREQEHIEFLQQGEVIAVVEEE